MHQHIPRHFGPTVVELLASAADDAWHQLVSNNDRRVIEKTLTREVVARRIMQGALLGERNPGKLKAAAMAKDA